VLPCAPINESLFGEYLADPEALPHILHLLQQELFVLLALMQVGDLVEGPIEIALLEPLPSLGVILIANVLSISVEPQFLEKDGDFKRQKINGLDEISPSVLQVRDPKNVVFDFSSFHINFVFIAVDFHLLFFQSPQELLYLSLSLCHVVCLLRFPHQYCDIAIGDVFVHQF